jgi:hypothetical protein
VAGTRVRGKKERKRMSESIIHLLKRERKPEGSTKIFLISFFGNRLFIFIFTYKNVAYVTMIYQKQTAEG